MTAKEWETHFEGVDLSNSLIPEILADLADAEKELTDLKRSIKTWGPYSDFLAYKARIETLLRRTAEAMRRYWKNEDDEDYHAVLAAIDAELGGK